MTLGPAATRRNLALGVATVLHGVVGALILNSPPPAPAFEPGMQSSMTVSLVDMCGPIGGGSDKAPQAESPAIPETRAAAIPSAADSGEARISPVPPATSSPSEAAGAGRGSLGTGTTTGMASTPTGQGSVLDVSGYRRALEAHIQRHRARAISTDRRTVFVRFTVNRHGEITEAWIQRSSGDLEIDKAALLTVERASPLPPIPDALPGLLDFSLPVVSG